MTCDVIGGGGGERVKAWMIIQQHFFLYLKVHRWQTARMCHVRVVQQCFQKPQLPLGVDTGLFPLRQPASNPEHTIKAALV